MSRIPCLSDATRESIAARLDAAKEAVRAGGSEEAAGEPLLFDPAQQEVEAHMARTSYLKFFESEIYLDYIQVCDA